jgi:hypothetical protein
MKNKLYILSVLVVIGLNPGFAQNYSRHGANTVSDNVTLSVIIPKIARVELCEAKNMIEISEADVARGYATLSKALSLKVWCNSSGSVVETELNGNVHDQDGRQFPGEMLMFRLSGQRDFHPFSCQAQPLYQIGETQPGSISEIDLRLNLSQGMEPGKYYFQPMFTVSSL